MAIVYNEFDLQISTLLETAGKWPTLVWFKMSHIQVGQSTTIVDAVVALTKRGPTPSDILLFMQSRGNNVSRAQVREQICEAVLLGLVDLTLEHGAYGVAISAGRVKDEQTIFGTSLDFQEWLNVWFGDVIYSSSEQFCKLRSMAVWMTAKGCCTTEQQTIITSHRLNEAMNKSCMWKCLGSDGRRKCAVPADTPLLPAQMCVFDTSSLVQVRDYMHSIATRPTDSDPGRPPFPWHVIDYAAKCAIPLDVDDPPATDITIATLHHWLQWALYTSDVNTEPAGVDVRAIVVDYLQSATTESKGWKQIGRELALGILLKHEARILVDKLPNDSTVRAAALMARFQKSLEPPTGSAADPTTLPLHHLVVDYIRNGIIICTDDVDYAATALNRLANTRVNVNKLF